MFSVLFSAFNPIVCGLFLVVGSLLLLPRRPSALERRTATRSARATVNR